MKRLQDFFHEERKRVVEPGPFFVHRVMAQLDEKAAPDVGVWDMIPASSRTILVAGLTIVMSLVAVDLFVPAMPQQGLIESFLASEAGLVEERLLSGSETADQEFIQELIAMEVVQ